MHVRAYVHVCRHMCKVRAFWVHSPFFKEPFQGYHSGLFRVTATAHRDWTEDLQHWKGQGITWINLYNSFSILKLLHVVKHEYLLKFLLLQYIIWHCISSICHIFPHITTVLQNLMECFCIRYFYVWCLMWALLPTPTHDPEVRYTFQNIYFPLNIIIIYPLHITLMQSAVFVMSNVETVVINMPKNTF